MSRPGPLAGVRVLDLTRLLPGPVATLHLADLGAEVIKIEDPQIGDYARTLGTGKGEDSAYFRMINRNKLGLCLDLKKPGAAEVFLRLAETADVVVESFRPGVVDKLVVYPERMQKNLDRMGGLFHSQRVLLALTQAGLARDDAYRLVQRNAMKVWESDGQLSLLELLKADPEVSAALSAKDLEDKFNLDYHFKGIDTIFARVFGEA